MDEDFVITALFLSACASVPIMVDLASRDGYRMDELRDAFNQMESMPLVVTVPEEVLASFYDRAASCGVSYTSPDGPNILVTRYAEEGDVADDRTQFLVARFMPVACDDLDAVESALANDVIMSVQDIFHDAKSLAGASAASRASIREEATAFVKQNIDDVRSVSFFRP